jgi:signal transduction histidine kinase
MRAGGQIARWLRRGRGRRRLPAPAPTIRLRLTVTYGLVFLLTGAVLLTIGYVLVRHNLDTRDRLRAELDKLRATEFSGYGRPVQFGPGTMGAAIYSAVHEQVVSNTLHRLVIDYILALAAMTAVSVAAGWLLAGRALAPLRKITATARRVSSENLGERIALSGPADELKQLADTFDRMLARLDGAFASQRHFVANASHELRTPLAIMRTEVDVALADPDASAEELRAMGEAVRETVDRSEGLIEALLTLARSEASGWRQEQVDLAAMVADCVTDFRAGAERAGIAVTTALQPAWVRGDPRLLERMIANLIDNGLRHNEPDGHLLVGTCTLGSVARLEVSNGGAAIDQIDADALTEPFRRLDRSSGGHGLGLSIVRSVAEAHRGAAVLTALPAGGLRARVELPAEAIPDGTVLARRPRSLTRS